MLIEHTEGYSYDAVVFSAASNYYQQQQRPQVPGMGGIKKTINGQGQKGPIRPQKAPPKPSQLHYCEICKISCAGPLTYKEHLEGQKHKKKENALKEAVPVTVKSSQPSFRCELCDVTCTGMDAYNAHIRGSKHGKVFKLHTRLGKPIPSTDPVKINPASSGQDKTENKTPGAASTATTAAAKKTVVKKPITPKISFVAGSKYSTTNVGAEEKDKTGDAAAKQIETKKQEQTDGGAIEVKDDDDSSNILPVGEDYVEEIRNEEGKLISFNCKLCECRFNDPHAKRDAHEGTETQAAVQETFFEGEGTDGDRNKVDPSLKVEAKPTQRNRRQLEEKMRRKMAKEEIMRRRDEELRWRSEMRKYDEEMFWRHMEEERYLEGMRHHEVMFHEWLRRGGPQSGLPPPPRGPFMELPSKKQENEIDRHVLAKHNTIYPKENELQAVQNMVSIIERALKMVSDFLAETDKPADVKTETKEEATPKEETVAKKEGEDSSSKDDTKEAKDADSKDQLFRVMKGVMRVGVLPRALTDQLPEHGVDRPLRRETTRTLLERVFDCLPKQLAVSSH
ncbi:putative zinc finger RNA-binding protein isoform X2 [Apostichopus japonicus]|uniref:Putative zinc finger RNA-binding protein isoform X2 n=1 Tax=Stichopus japonicus TaxID=307972 RepID=A0A2G8K876_STIJA|nr:putative zinc finger RNA-binding protein isoform X2 [Apostichopus japonicus]